MELYRRPDGGPRVSRGDQLLFESALVAVGVFDARPDDPHFRCSGPPGEHLLVFPATAVEIRDDGETPFVADRNVVTLYEPDQVYSRSALSRLGDRGHWFSLAPRLVEEIFAPVEREPRRRRTDLFPARRVSADPSSHVAQLGFVRRLVSEVPPDPLCAEESVLALARRVAAAATSGTASAARPLSRRQRSLAERARSELATAYARSESLSAMARRIGASPSHLSRVFRRATGRTLHDYREQLRLRRAWHELPQRLGDLTGLALDLGYSSHSHFTAAFRRAFGLPPSAAGRRLAAYAASRRAPGAFVRA